MNFQQLRYVRETVRQGLNLTEAANKLFTSQPGVSKQIRELENELGVEIFVRRGKRLVALTEPGRMVVRIIEDLLQLADNLRGAAREFQDQASGTLAVATTHTQARYSLPTVVRQFKRRYPKVHLTLKQGNPPQLAEMVLAGEADVAIATEALDHYPKLLALPGFQWNHCVVVPAKHPLAKSSRVTLEEVARYPLITYDPAFAGRTHIDEAFAARGLHPDIVLSAIDADVIKTYVELDMGVGIVAAMAFDPKRDRGLRALDASHLFKSNTTRIAIRRGAYLRGYAYAFIELFSPQLSREVIDAALAGKGEMYEL
ncbi:MAG TPA: CysB family HTH-type transcriptional regulator [Burkholderiales bacterium]|nr:CysB family HTH-type transcriptional regulator [Burkholderiales bacterium]